MGHDWTDAVTGTDWQYAELFSNPQSPTPLASGPIALTRDNGIDVFAFCAEIAEGAIFWTRWPGYGGWPAAPTALPLYPQIFSAPAATSWNDAGRLDVFAAVSNDGEGELAGKLVHWWLDLPINQTTWAYEVLVSSELSTQPCAVSWGAEHLDVFAMGANASLVRWTFDQPTGVNFGVPETLIGEISSPPCAVSYEANRLDVFASSTQAGGILHWVYDATNPAAIVPFGNPQLLTGSRGCKEPSAVSWGPGTVDVVAVDSEGRLLHWYFNGGGGNAMSLDSSAPQVYPIVSTPAAASSSVDTFEIAIVCDTGSADMNGEQQKVLQVQYLLRSR